MRCTIERGPPGKVDAEGLGTSSRQTISRVICIRPALRAADRETMRALRLSRRGSACSDGSTPSRRREESGNKSLLLAQQSRLSAMDEDEPCYVVHPDYFSLRARSAASRGALWLRRDFLSLTIPIGWGIRSRTWDRVSDRYPERNLRRRSQPSGLLSL